MRNALLLSLAIVALPAAANAAGPDAAARAILDASPTMIADPQWAHKPTGYEMSRAYPDRGMMKEKHGEVQLICRVRLDGAVSHCGVLSAPYSGRYGFGEAALSLTPKFRLTPKTVEGMPVDGAAVIIRSSSGCAATYSSGSRRFDSLVGKPTKVRRSVEQKCVQATVGSS